MSARIISPEAGSPAGQMRGAEAAAKASRSLDASQAWNRSSWSGRTSSAGSAAAGAGAVIYLALGLSQSRGVSSTSVSTPASAHQASALSAAACDNASLPLSTTIMESASGGLVNL
jgi:hypothetical protein